MKVLFDTNILIDYLLGIPAARTELEGHADAAISVITWLEVMAGASEEEDAAVRLFLGSLPVVPISQAVMDEAVSVRRRRRLKLPDAIILATANVEGRLLLTRNTKDFAGDDPRVRVPYRV